MGGDPDPVCKRGRLRRECGMRPARGIATMVDKEVMGAVGWLSLRTRIVQILGSRRILGSRKAQCDAVVGWWFGLHRQVGGGGREKVCADLGKVKGGVDDGKRATRRN